MKVLTEAMLRSRKVSMENKICHVEKGVFVTPMALEYLRDRGVELVEDEVSSSDMTVNEIKPDGDRTYVDYTSGAGYRDKPEEMTHLYGNVLVKKTHPRIVLRGKLDSLQALIMFMRYKQSLNKNIEKDLGDISDAIADTLGAEVKNTCISKVEILGFEDEELRKVSHNVKLNFGIEHRIPEPSMGECALMLNYLRTQIREAELAAAEAFPKGDELGIIRMLNRLSSAVYILYCRVITDYYK